MPGNSCGRRDHLLFELVNAVGNSLSLDETLGELDRRLHPIVPYDAIVVWLEVEGRLAAAYLGGEEARHLAAPEFAAGNGSLERAGSAFDGRLPSSLAVNIAHPDPIGVLALYRREAEGFAESDRDALLDILPKASSAIANARRYENVARLASIDAESSLLNRRALFLRLDAEVARARRHHSGLAVLACEIGSRAAPWRELASGLRQVCREEDCLARMGDSIVLVLPGFVRSHLPEKQAQVERLAAGYGLKMRVGAAFFPDDGFYADDLLAAAGERRSRARK